MPPVGPTLSAMGARVESTSVDETEGRNGATGEGDEENNETGSSSTGDENHEDVKIKEAGAAAKDPNGAGEFAGVDLRDKIDRLLRSGEASVLAVPLKLGLFKKSIGIETEESTGTLVRRAIYQAEDGDGLQVLNNMEEIHNYLMRKNLDIQLSCFSFDVDIAHWESPSTIQAKLNQDSKVVTNDWSEGRERIPVQVVCEKNLKVERSLPVYIEQPFLSRELEEKYSLEHDDGFLVCCDCKDDCKDKLNCECFKRTLDNCSEWTRITVGDEKIGYNYQRLEQSFLSGIFECSKLCKCNQKRCFNRVVQNGSNCHLQVFMTEKKGWGVRTLADIEKGDFICIYAGMIVSPTYADKVSSDRLGRKWIYLCELALGEEGKPGYEAEAIEPEDGVPGSAAAAATSSSSRKRKISENVKDQSEDATRPIRSESRSVPEPDSLEALQWKVLQMQAARNFAPMEEEAAEIEELSNLNNGKGEHWKEYFHDLEETERRKRTIERFTARARMRASIGKDDTTTPFLFQDDFHRLKMSSVISKTQAEETASCLKLSVTKTDANGNNDPQNPPDPVNFNLSLDGYNSCNVGALLNHSCDPNAFPQYVFWNCQDLNLPTIAFFANKNIKSGEEICWDYKYENQEETGEPGSAQSKQIRFRMGRGGRAVSNTGNPSLDIFCQCGASNCTNMLLS